MLGNAVACRWVPVARICQFAEDFNCVSETRSGESGFELPGQCEESGQAGRPWFPAAGEFPPQECA